MRAALFAASVFLAATLGAQQTSSPPDRYKVRLGGVDFLSEPKPNSKRIGEIPADVVVTPLAKNSYWIKVKYAGKTGWISSVGCDRLMATPSADLDIVHEGYKVIDGKYRYYFGLRNEGVVPYTGDVTVHLYAGDIELPLQAVGSIAWSTPRTYMPNEVGSRGYPLDPGDVIKPGQVRSYYLIADRLATRYVFETAQGKKEGAIGKRLRFP